MQSKALISLLDTTYKQMKLGNLKTFIPLLGLFYLRGNPMTLKTHYQFAPMYNTVMPSKQLWMTGRQMGKSFGISSSNALKCALVPFFHTMIVQPRADQIQRLNNTVMKPLLLGSPIQSHIITKTLLNKMALKQFKSGSLLYMDFCFLSPDRLRGASGLANIILDEIQDILYLFLPVIELVTSASLHWGYTQYAGTPKTTDTTLGLLWLRCSQALWIIKCTHCGHDNIPNPLQHLKQMIGKTGIICYNCGKELSPANGRYIHGIASRRAVFPGYHISQLTHPFHLDKEHPLRWLKLLNKVENYGTMLLYNEVFGWPYDLSTSPLILKDLLLTRHKLKVLSAADVAKISHNYRMLAIGVDWSGGAEQSDSFTSMSVAGLRKDSNVVDILYGKRFPKGLKPYDLAILILSWVQQIGADVFAHDNSGPGGYLRMLILKQLGINELDCKVIPYTYVGNSLGDIIKFHPATRDTDRYYYSLDKSRSLAIMVQALKDKRIRVPYFLPDDAKHFNYDYLALRLDPRKTAGNNVIIHIIKKPGVPDDHAHATNFAVSAIWDICRAYPKLGTSIPSKYVNNLLDSYDSTYLLLLSVKGPRAIFQQAILNTQHLPTIILPDFNIWSN